MKVEALKKRWHKNRPMTGITIRIPEDVIEDLKRDRCGDIIISWEFLQFFHLEFKNFQFQHQKLYIEALILPREA